MNITTRICGMVSAAVLFVGSTVPAFPQVSPKPQKMQSVLEFAAAVTGSTVPEPFAELRYQPGDDTIFRDGRPVGGSFGGFMIAGGNLLAEQGNDTLTLAQASETMGCEIYTDSRTGETVVVSPYQNGRVIVRSEKPVDPLGGRVLASGYRGLTAVQFDSPAAAYAACMQYRNDPDISLAEPDRILRTDAAGEEYDSLARVREEWGAEALGASRFLERNAADFAKAGDIKVAVIDTGIYAQHEMFTGRIAEGGMSFVAPVEKTYDDFHGHGTHCAGIICSVTPENVKILPLKGLDATGSGDSLGIYCAMLYAAEQKADVVSMSLGGTGLSPLMNEASDVLAEAGIPCIVAAGNETMDVKYSSPANHPANIAVAAVGRDTNGGQAYIHAGYSNFGGDIDFAAPGSDILSAGTYATAETVKKTGTSMSAPFVAGCVADMLVLRPELANAEIYRYLKANALDLGTPGKDEYYGWGMVQLGTFAFADGTVSPPKASVAGGDYAEELPVKLETETEGAEIYYTLDGSVPDKEHGLKYDGNAAMIPRSCTLTAAAFLGESMSKLLCEDYNLYCRKPFIIPNGGTFDEPVSVTLKADKGAEIYYTTDGTLPTPETAQRYDGTPVTVGKTSVLQAVAVLGEAVSPCAGEDFFIGDTDYSRLFAVKDGVLLRYGGAMSDIDLTKMLPDTEIIEIGAGAFAGLDKLENVILPETVKAIGGRAFADCTALRSIRAKGVQRVGDSAFYHDTLLDGYTSDFSALEVIGANAFAGCRQLDAPCFQPDKLTEIGDSAFAESRMPKEVSLTALKKLGSAAFEGAFGLQKLILPETLAELPAYTCRNCQSLKSLTAEGVSVVGDEALSGCRALEQVNMDFGGITVVGAGAFASVQFEQPVEFTSLRDVGKRAFADVWGVSFSFPALVDIRRDTLADMEYGTIILENAEILRTSCITLNSFVGLVTGDKLETIEPCAVGNIARGRFCAGSPDSPMKAYTLAQKASYLDTPNLYAVRYEYEANQFDTVKFETQYLGTGVQAQWYCAGRADDTGTACGEVDTTGIFRADTTKPGVYYYYAVLTDSRGRENTTRRFRVEVKPATIGGTLHSGMNILNLGTQGADSVAYFSYTAEDTGRYYIYCCDNTVRFRIRHGGMTEQLKDYRQEPVTLEKGETVEIIAQKKERAGQYSGLWIRTEPFEPGAYYLEDDGGYLDFSAEGIHPAVRVYEERSHEDPDGGWVEEEPLLLAEGGQYILVADEVGIPGETRYYIFITGENGTAPAMLVGTAYSAALLEENKPYDLPYLTDSDCIFRFVPEENGSYLLGVSMREDVPEDLKKLAKSIGEDQNADIQMTLYEELDGTEERVGTWTNNTAQFLNCGSVFELRAGRRYSLHISTDSAESLIGDVLTVQLLRDKKPLARCLPVFTPGTVIYTGEPLVMSVRLTDTEDNWKELESGRDYTLKYFNDEHAGYIYAMLTGTGDYAGCCVCALPAGVPEEYVHPEKITGGQTVTQTDALAYYEIEFGGSTQLQVQTENNCPWPEQAVLFSLDKTGRYWEPVTSLTEKFNTYPLWVNQRYLLMVIPENGGNCTFSIKAAAAKKTQEQLSVEPFKTGWTGEPVMPHPVVYDTGTTPPKLLSEGKDYIVLAGNPIDAGVYRYTVQGCGGYTGVVQAELIITPTAETLLPELKQETELQAGSENGIFYHLRAEAGQYVFWKDSLTGYNIRIYDARFEEVAAFSGIGYQAEDAELVKGHSYYIVALSETAEPGTAVLHAMPGGKLISGCRLEMPVAIQTDGTPVIPEYRLYDGDTLLTGGKDYEMRGVTGSEYDGRAMVRFRGLGAYAGELEAYFYTYTSVEDFMWYARDYFLTADYDQDIQFERDVPGTIRAYTCTASRNADYYFILPDSETIGVTTLCFDTNGNLLDPTLRKLYMQSGEEIIIVCITDWLESDFETTDIVEIAVRYSVPGGEFEADGIRWYLSGGYAAFNGFTEDSPLAAQKGIRLPERVYYAKYDTEFPVTGISDTESLADKIVYVENSGKLQRACGFAGLHWAYVSPQEELSGDVSGDGQVTLTDLLIVYAWLGESAGMEMCDTAFTNADTNADGVLTLADAALIVKMLSWEELAPA